MDRGLSSHPAADSFPARCPGPPQQVNLQQIIMSRADVKIACSRSLLRPVELADAASLARHANDRRVWQSLRDGFPRPYPEADAVAYIEHLAARPIQASFGIDVDGQPIGSSSLEVGEDIARPISIRSLQRPSARMSGAQNQPGSDATTAGRVDRVNLEQFPRRHAPSLPGTQGAMRRSLGC
jgi:hypothetical protein